MCAFAFVSAVAAAASVPCEIKMNLLQKRNWHQLFCLIHNWLHHLTKSQKWAQKRDVCIDLETRSTHTLSSCSDIMEGAVHRHSSLYHFRGIGSWLQLHFKQKLSNHRFLQYMQQNLPQSKSYLAKLWSVKWVWNIYITANMLHWTSKQRLTAYFRLTTL